MVVTITGGTGFIGKPLVAALRRRGDVVRTLGRSPKTGVDPDVRFFLWDAAASAPPVESLEGAEAVVHLAGEPVAQRWSPEIKHRIRSSRVEGTRHLVESLAKLSSPPSVLISVSAIGYYGDRGDEQMTEDASPGHGFLSEVCVGWEAEADKAAELGIRVVKPRIGVVLGVGGGALRQMLPPFRMFVGGQLASGRQWMSWIHLTDVVGLIEFALDHPDLRGPLNATAPNPVRNARFTRVLARTLRRPALFTVPGKGLRILFGEMAEILLAGQRVQPRAAEAAGYQFQYPDLALALKNILG